MERAMTVFQAGSKAASIPLWRYPKCTPVTQKAAASMLPRHSMRHRKCHAATQIEPGAERVSGLSRKKNAASMRPPVVAKLPRTSKKVLKVHACQAN